MRNLIILIAFICIEFCGCTSVQDKNNAVIPQDLKMKEVSTRWKQEHKIEDFNWLKDNYIKPGCSKEFVKEVLGEPLHIFVSSESKEEHWLYVRWDIQHSGWFVVIDSNGKIIDLLERIAFQ